MKFIDKKFHEMLPRVSILPLTKFNRDIEKVGDKHNIEWQCFKIGTTKVEIEISISTFQSSLDETGGQFYLNVNKVMIKFGRVNLRQTR